LLASTHRNVMVVGDDAQSIYSWRGANFQNIMSFPERYADCKVFKIESNYRSTPQILTAANAAIRPNTQQFPKELHSTRKAGGRPALLVCQSAGQEAQFVAQRVAELAENGVPLDEIAVLYRAHFHSMELQMELTRRNVPFVINSGIRFFEQAHIKDVAAFLRLGVNVMDELAFKRIARLLPGVGDRTADKLWLKLAAHTEFPKSLTAKDVVAAVPAKAAADWKQLGHTFEQITEENTVDDPAEQIRIVVEAMYDDFLKTAYTDYDYRNRHDDLDRFMQFAATFETTAAFLEQMALLTNVDTERPTQGEDRESMWLSTVHQAKGLEWHTVFIIGLADEMFPSVRALEVRGGEEEERRLFYVAITRAKDELYLTFPMTRGMRGQEWTVYKPSRFVRDIPESMLETWKLSVASTQGLGGSSGTAFWGSGSSQRGRRSFED
jgi:DNA helicase-2/ATP-dependent DNA helicase PcrA